MNATWRTGAWRVLGERQLFERVRAELEQQANEARSARGGRALDAHATYFKGSPLRTRPALRHALRHAAGRELPRLQESKNLTWLRARAFLAPRPLLAGVWTRAGLPRYQFLFTELIPGAPALSEWLGKREEGGADRALRAALLASLARDVARLHHEGFVHRDLFPRNLLACALDTTPRCAFLDAWRGGPGLGLRGPDHDLGCFFLDGADLLGLEEQLLFLTTYQEESERRGRKLTRDWPARVERARSALLRREAARRPGLASTWRFPRPSLIPSPLPSD